MSKKVSLKITFFLAALALFSGLILNQCTAQGENTPNAEAVCENKTGFVICIPDGFRF